MQIIHAIDKVTNVKQHEMTHAFQDNYKTQINSLNIGGRKIASLPQ